VTDRGALRRSAPWLGAALIAYAGTGLACAARKGTAPPVVAPVSRSSPEAELAPPPALATPAVVWPAPDRTQPPWSQTPVAPIAPGAVQRERGKKDGHLRIGTEHGVVHAWRPRGYKQKSAGTVIYLHGYYTDVDQAWADHRLEEQFRASGRNALFLAVEAPSWNGEEPFWPTLDELLRSIEKVTGLRIPPGPLVVAGHSGAFRGIIPWLADPRVSEVLLLDGLYQNEQDWADWLDGAPRGKRRLVLVGLETAARSEAWIPTRPGAVFLPRVPPASRGLKRPEQSAPVLYMRSQLDHMSIIERGEVLPLLLKNGRLQPHAVGKP
jgi:hypothetical protein